MIALVALFLAAMAPQDATAPQEEFYTDQHQRVIRTYEHPVRGTSRCLRDLPRARQVTVPITCKVNSIGGPTQCVFDDSATREQRYATECVSRGYRFHWPDGTPATGAQVTFRVHLRTL
jgi:hypothetical protein